MVLRIRQSVFKSADKLFFLALHVLCGDYGIDACGGIRGRVQEVGILTQLFLHSRFHQGSYIHQFIYFAGFSLCTPCSQW